MSQQRITNAEIARRLEAMFDRLDTIVSGVNDMKLTLRLMDSRVSALEQEVAEHRRVLFGTDGGMDKLGMVDDLRDVRRAVVSTQRAVSRAMWAILSTLLGGIGLWLAHALGLRW